MQLGYIMSSERGGTDRFLAQAAAYFQDAGVQLAGVVQTNIECGDDRLCDMDLQVLPTGETIRISQSLGAGARGCRLDPAALEQAVGLVSAALNAGPQLLLVNKFGKHEADGRGFRPIIGEALLRDIPVLVGLNGLNEDKFLSFSDGAARHLPTNIEAVQDWLAEVQEERRATG